MIDQSINLVFPVTQISGLSVCSIDLFLIVSTARLIDVIPQRMSVSVKPIFMCTAVAPAEPLNLWSGF